MLMKDSTAVKISGACRSTSWAVQFCLTPGLLSTRSKVIKYKYVKNSNKIIGFVTRKSDKNQLEPGEGVGLSPQIYQLDIHLIFWSYMKLSHLHVHEY